MVVEIDNMIKINSDSLDKDTYELLALWLEEAYNFVKDKRTEASIVETVASIEHRVEYIKEEFKCWATVPLEEYIQHFIADYRGINFTKLVETLDKINLCVSTKYLILQFGQRNGIL